MPPRDAAQFAVDMALVAAGEAAGTARPSLIILPVLSMLEDLVAGRRTLVMASQVRKVGVGGKRKHFFMA